MIPIIIAHITRTIKADNKVGIVTGGGSGHLPVFTGYIGKGLLDTCAIGSEHTHEPRPA